VTYFFDNTFPPQLAKIVAILGVDAVHLHDEFPPNTLDVTWIPEIGRRGWVVITADRGISKKPAERKALEEANVISVFMAKGFTTKPIFELVSLFVKWWPDIDRSVQRVKPGTSLRVNPNGKIDLL
jgi:PIN like domain